MAQQQKKKAEKQQDPYVQRGKTLASSVQRLRGWVGSDPTRVSELADALVELTTHRLLGHAYAAAATDAQEAVKYAAQLLTANGPIGPYTSTTDAVRYVTGVLQLATIQAGLGLTDAAARTLASLADTQEQLSAAGIELTLEPSAAVWASSGSARTALATGDAAAANAHADAALKRAIDSGLLDDPRSIYLAVDVERLASDARWAVGQTEPALGYLLSAKDRYDAFVGDRLREPGRVGQAVLERLAEPLPGLYGVTADRLTAIGETALGLAVRRTLIDLLSGLVSRLGEATGADLESAQAALAAEYVSAERTPSAPPRPSILSPEAPALDRERQRAAAAWLDRERPEALRLEQQRRDAALAEAERRDAERQAEELSAAERVVAQRAAADEAARREAQQVAAVEEAERLERKRRREERLEAHRLEVEQREAAQREAERMEIERREAARRQADPAEAERLELKRLQEELVELERAEAARAAAERADAERQERAEGERLAAERERREAERAEAERQEAARLEAARQQEERREAERQESERAEAEQREAEHDELSDALRTWDDLKAQGDRRAARAANERVVELLRPRAEADLTRFGPQLVTALEELSRARLRGGDIFGSRTPAREAKALARTLAQ